MRKVKIKKGDWVKKTKGDYTYRGDVRAVVIKRSGARRPVVENDDGQLHIFSESQLELDK